MPQRIACARCEHIFIFDRPVENHFRNGVCCHCRAEIEFGSSQVVATLLDTRTGETKEFREKVIHHTHDLGVVERVTRFAWLENNYACDCNRSRCMYPGDESKHIIGCKGDNEILLLSLTMGGVCIFDAADSEACTGAGRFKD